MFEGFWRYFSKNRGAIFGLVVVELLTLAAIGAQALAPHDPYFTDTQALRLPPAWSETSPPEAGTARHWLGTDDVGRDVLSRLLFGARISMGIGFLVVGLSLTFGAVLGLISGYYGGWVDRLVMRTMDLQMALPSILLAIVVVSILGPSLINTVIAVSIVEFPKFVRLVRAQVIAEKGKPYVLASQSFGASSFRQMVINILPNCAAPLIVQGTLGFSDGILNAAALGFLGLGAQAPTAEWGTMLADARPFIESSPWLVTLPGLCIFLAVMGFNLLGDGLRDAFDPKLRR
jgi:ABC-type dipeptide/oligopeptide/nickel transport system permease subunit